MTTLHDVQIYYQADEFGSGAISLIPLTGAEVISHDEGVADNLGWGTLLAFDSQAEAKAFLVGVDMCGDENDICYETLILPDGSAVVLVIDTDGKGGIEQYLDKRSNTSAPLALPSASTAASP